MGSGRKAAFRRAMAVLLLVLLLAGAALPGAEKAAAQVYSIALPDITSTRFSARPETVKAGGTLEIRNAVQNLGAGALTPAHGMAEEGPTLTIRFLLVRNVKDAGGIHAGSWSLEALARREVKWHSAIWTVPETVAPGLYFLCADVDPENTVRESNELNNRTCLPLTVEAAPEMGAGDKAGGERPETPGDGGADDADGGDSEPARPGPPDAPEPR